MHLLPFPARMVFFAVLASLHHAADRKPNIILLLADDFDGECVPKPFPSESNFQPTK